MNIPKRIQELRTAMESCGADAYIITGSDPHGSEYMPLHWRTREWVSGFTGSAGTIVITQSGAGLWTDFRYWIQAAAELEGSGIDLHRDIAEMPLWIVRSIPKGGTVSVDGRTLDAQSAQKWEKVFRSRGLNFDTRTDLIVRIWADRPDMPNSPVTELTEEITGESRRSRLNRLQTALKNAGADTWAGISLDTAAWLLNIRGSDVPYCPVVTGFVLYSKGAGRWFTDQSRVSDTLKEHLAADGITVSDYDDFFPALENLSADCRVLVDRTVTSKAVTDRLAPESVIDGADPVVQMKSRKNSVQAERIRQAMVKDGLAVVRFFRELKQAMENGTALTEIQAADMLSRQRRAVPGFLGESFTTIPAFGPHGAICHYSASNDSALTLTQDSSLFLIDSGGQWEQGTTDITRTLALGSPTPEQKTDYTLTLKGHLALSAARFPKGTRGYQLDALTRAPLWRHGADYGHGTGHGVGYRLSVHEGPQKLSTAPTDVAIEPGMVISNEPGIYREGLWGIRIENLLICREDDVFDDFLTFDTLTLAPYERELIETAMLDAEEITWINSYHRRVWDELSPALNPEDRQWLNTRTAPLSES